MRFWNFFGFKRIRRVGRFGKEDRVRRERKLGVWLIDGLINRLVRRGERGLWVDREYVFVYGEEYFFFVKVLNLLRFIFVLIVFGRLLFIFGL